MSRPVVISSGTVNRYGFRLMPEGARLERYQKNPVLLYDHGGDSRQQMVPIGTVQQLSLQNGVLVGTPEFDQDDEFARMIGKKWDKGILNAVSVWWDGITLSSDPKYLLPGQTHETVVEWDLLEVSITPVPADGDAVKLHLEEGKTIDDIVPRLEKKLSLDNNKNAAMKSIAQKLGLPEDATEDQINMKLDELNNSQLSAKKARIDSLIELGKTKGVVNDDNEEPYRKLAASDYDNAEKLIKLSAAKQDKSQSADDKEEKKETLSLKELIDGVMKANQGGVQAKPEETFEYLSKHNPEKLNEIRTKEPEKYQKLAAEYAKRPAKGEAPTV